MNKDSQQIFENYLAGGFNFGGTVEEQDAAAQDPTIAANQGLNTPAPAPAPAAGAATAAAQAGATQTDVLAGVIANGDKDTLTKLFAIPGVTELLDSVTQSPATAAANPPVEMSPAEQAAAAGVQGNL